MSSDPDISERRFLTWLVLVTGVLNASLFLMIAGLTHGDSLYPWLVIMFLIALLLFLLSLGVLLVMACLGAMARLITKMEAWWWLSAPHSIGFQVAVFTLALQEFGHFLGPFLLFFFIVALSSALWMLVTITQVAFSKERHFGARQRVMLALGALAVMPWAWWLK